MNKSHIFQNNYIKKYIANKEYFIRGISLNDMLNNTEIFNLLFDVVLDLQDPESFDNPEIFTEKYKILLSTSLSNYVEEDDENIFQIIVELLDLSLPPKLRQQYEEPTKGKEIKHKKQESSIKEQKLALYKNDYLKRIDIEEAIYNYVEVAEFLRTKNIISPYDLTLKNLIVLADIHNRIENNKLIKELDLQISAISVFKTKNSKIYEDFVTKMIQ